MAVRQTDLLQGTLDLLVLRCLSSGPNHGYGIASRIHVLSDEVLRIEEGSLYPSLYRMEEQGLIESEWGVTENNRKAKFYRLTRKGRAASEAELASWSRLSQAVTRVLRAIRKEPDMRFRPPRLLRRTPGVLHLVARDREMDREMAFHIESIKRDLIDSGMAEADADRAARQRFGRVRQLKEEGHDIRSARILDDLSRDARHMARGLRRVPCSRSPSC